MIFYSVMIRLAILCSMRFAKIETIVTMVTKLGVNDSTVHLLKRGKQREKTDINDNADKLI